MTRLTVTAIVPVYNGRTHLAATMRSIFAQQTPPDEIIIIDDGSTDDSLEVIETLDSPLPVKVVSQANQGQSIARNEAARIASGELLAFLDQDDLWHPRHLTRLTRSFAAMPDLGWAYSDFDEIDVSGRMVTRGFIRAYNLEHPKSSINQYLTSDLMMLPSASVIRASALQAVGGFDANLCGYEDDELFIRMFRGGWNAEYVKAPLTQFRVHAASASAGARFRSSRVYFLDKLIEELPNDTRLNRYYIHDLVFPRLFRSTLAEYATALRNNNYQEAAQIAATVAELSERAPAGLRRRVELALISRPALADRVLRAVQALPSRLRPNINAALVSTRRQGLSRLDRVRV